MGPVHSVGSERLTEARQDPNQREREIRRVLPAAAVAFSGAGPGAGPVDRTRVRRT